MLGGVEGKQWGGAKEILALNSLMGAAQPEVEGGLELRRNQ